MPTFSPFALKVFESFAPWLEKDSKGPLWPLNDGTFPGVYPAESLYPSGTMLTNASDLVYPEPDLYPSPDLYPEPSFYSGDLAGFLAAVCAMFDAVAQIVMDQGSYGDADYVPGWGTLLDPTTCPDWALPYLGQFVGVPILQGTDATYARTQILAEGNLHRGTRTSIIWAVQQNLSGTQSVTVVEREGLSGPDPYHFIVIVRPEEVVNVTLLTQMVNDRKPAGLQWTLVQTDGYTWAAAIHTWSADTFTWTDAGRTQP